MGRDKRILKKIRPAVTWCDGWHCCAGRRAEANPAQMAVASLDQTWLRSDRPAHVGNQPAAVAGRGRVRHRRFGLAQPGPDRRRSSGRPDPRRGGSRAQLGRRAPADLLARAHRDGLRRGPGPGAGAVGAQLGGEVAGRLPDRGPAHRRGVPARPGSRTWRTRRCSTTWPWPGTVIAEDTVDADPGWRIRRARGSGTRWRFRGSHRPGSRCLPAGSSPRGRWAGSCIPGQAWPGTTRRRAGSRWVWRWAWPAARLRTR